MQHSLYLLGLVSALCCLTAIDYRWQLAFFYNWRRTLYTLMPAIAYFITWDISGIKFHIFGLGHSNYLTGIRLAPNFPLEELFFLALLTYTTLLVWRSRSVS